MIFDQFWIVDIFVVVHFGVKPSKLAVVPLIQKINLVFVSFTAAALSDSSGACMMGSAVSTGASQDFNKRYRYLTLSVDELPEPPSESLNGTSL